MQVYRTKINRPFKKSKVKREIRVLKIGRSINAKENVATDLVVIRVKATVKTKLANFFIR
jgi:hypothetical protein